MRINLETDSFLNPAFDLLARILEIDPDAARWKVVKVWAACSAKRSPVLSIEEVDLSSGMDGFAPALVEVDLAQAFAPKSVERSLADMLVAPASSTRSAAQQVVERAIEHAKRIAARGGSALQISGVASRIAYLFAQSSRASKRDLDQNEGALRDLSSERSLLEARGARSRKRKAVASGNAEADRAEPIPPTLYSSSTLPLPLVTKSSAAPLSRPAAAPEVATGRGPEESDLSFLDPKPAPSQSVQEPRGEAEASATEAEHPRAVRLFAELFKKHRGADATWGAAEGSMVKGLLKKAGGSADELARRARIMFEQAGRWPVEHGGDLRTLAAHFDRFASEPVEAKQDVKVGRVAARTEESYYGPSGPKEI